MKLNDTNVIIALLVLVLMSLTCQINKLMNWVTAEKFNQLNTSELYSRGSCDNCFKLNEHSQEYRRKEMEKVQELCSDSQPDPCPHALNNHPKVPEDVRKTCCSKDLLKYPGVYQSVKDKCQKHGLLPKNDDIVSEEGAVLFSEEDNTDYQELLRLYKNGSADLFPTGCSA